MNIKAGQKTKKNVNTLKKILVYVYGGPAEKSQNEKFKFLILQHLSSHLIKFYTYQKNFIKFHKNFELTISSNLKF